MLTYLLSFAVLHLMSDVSLHILSFTNPLCNCALWKPTADHKQDMLARDKLSISNADPTFYRCH